MPSNFVLKKKNEVKECVKCIKKFTEDFGLSTHKSELFALAVSEAGENALRYANGATVIVDYTQNKKGIEVRIEDEGKGIANFKEALKDGYTSRENSLGMGLGAIHRCVDNFIVEKNDTTGLSLLLQVFLNMSEYDSAIVSVKKEDQDFNGDACLIHHYNGDSSLFAVIDGAGSGLKAYKSSMFVYDLFIENASLPLDKMLQLCHKKLKNSELTRATEIAVARLKDNKLEYVILGNTRIKSYPNYSFISQSGSLGLSLPKEIYVHTQNLDKNFCLALSSDGIDSVFELYNLYETSSADTLARGIFNNYNNDDDSSIIIIKR